MESNSFAPIKDRRIGRVSTGRGKRTVQADAAQLEQTGHVLASLAALDKLVGVYLLPG